MPENDTRRPKEVISPVNSRVVFPRLPRRAGADIIAISPVGEQVVYPVGAGLIIAFPSARVMMVMVVAHWRMGRVSLHAVLLETLLLLLLVKMS